MSTLPRSKRLREGEKAEEEGGGGEGGRTAMNGI